MSATARRLVAEPQSATRPRALNLQLPSFQYDARLVKLYSLSLLISVAYLLFGWVLVVESLSLKYKALILGASFSYDTGTIGSLTTTPQFQAYFGELREIVKGAVGPFLLATANNACH